MTVSLEKAISPEAAVAALKLENQRLSDTLEILQAERDQARRELGGSDARISNLRDAWQREKGEAEAAREKYAKLRTEARDLVRELVSEYDLEDYREEISRKIVEIGLDSLDYTYKGSITLTIDFEGLRREDGSEVTEDDVRTYLAVKLEESGPLDEPGYYDWSVTDIDLELE